MGLLQRTIRLYSIFSFCVLLLGIPVFYFLLQYTVREEVDEELLIYKSAMLRQISKPGGIEDLRRFHAADHNITIEPGDHLSATEPDRYFTRSRYDSVISETVKLRMLETLVAVKSSRYRVTLSAPMVDHNDLIGIVLLVQIILLGLLFAGLWVINKTVSRAYLAQKEFTENASHELQTPLAVFQSKLELLMQTSPLNNSQADLISQMADASQRMNKLNRALILLTKIQNRQFTEKEKVDPAEIVQYLIGQYEDAISQKAITLHLNIISSEKIETNRPLLELLIGNLLSNAIRHNTVSGRVNIVLTGKELSVENTGSAAPLDTLKLFQRFEKNSDDHNSLGLGLEIMKRICEINHYAIKYRYQNGMHGFVIRF